MAIFVAVMYSSRIGRPKSVAKKSCSTRTAHFSHCLPCLLKVQTFVSAIFAVLFHSTVLSSRIFVPLHCMVQCCTVVRELGGGK